MRTILGRLGGVGLLTVLLAGNSWGQVTLFPIDGQPLVLTGSMRTRAYAWDFFNPGPRKGVAYQNRYSYGANVLRLGLGYKTHGVSVFGELMNPTLIGIPDAALAPAPQGALGLGANYYQANRERYGSSIFLKQAYALVQGEGLRVQGGRFEFSEGADLPPKDAQLRWIVTNEIQQRLIGNFGFSDGMRSIDGVTGSYAQSSWNVTAMAGVPTQGVFALDGMKEVKDVNVEYGAWNMGSNAAWGDSLGRVFFIHYHDGRGLPPLAGAIGIETLGADWVHALPAGPGAFDITGWGAYQWGAWGTKAQRAYAYVGALGYRLTHAAWQPWLRAEYTVGSGDRNPGSATHGTFFPMLPTPRIYALDPFYNMMNLRDAAADVILDPTPRLEWRTTVRGLWLDSSRDQWYAGGGAFNNSLFGFSGRPSGGNRYLASVADSGASWKVDRHLTLAAYLGHAFGGPVVRASFPAGHQENFALLESGVSF